LGLIKIYGKAYFLFCMTILFFNIALDNFFYWIKPNKRNPTIKKMIDLDKKMFFKYFPIILFSYSKKTSSAKKFLKYELS
jgi:accessory colonization factor AcfC